jgi:TRAP-type transport system periplasmic protein
MQIFSSLAVRAGFAAAMLGLAGAAVAQDLPRMHFKALIHDSPSPHVKLVEAPFWNETVPKASGGQITADAAPLDQLGVADEAVLRLLKLGAFDFASFDIVKLGGDDPRFEGCDLSGLTFTFEQTRAACNAWRATMDRIMQQNWNTKLLAIASAPPQAIWCAPEIKGIDDLKGKKLRVYSKTMIDFANAVGATPLNINFREVVTALQNKVVDCAVTGTSVGNVSGWIEVTKYLMPISLGWAVNVHTVNLAAWRRMDPKVQAFFTKQFAEMEDKFWATMKETADDAENCNVGKQPCRLGKLANMTVVRMNDADTARFKKLMQETVLNSWAKRAGAEAGREWNATVGKVLGMETTP